MSKKKTFSELMELASVNSTEIAGKKAMIDFTVVGDGACTDIMIALGNLELIIKQFFVMNSDSPEDIPEEYFDEDFVEENYKDALALVDDFFDNARIADCDFYITLDVEKRAVLSVVLGMNGTYKGAAFSGCQVKLESYEIFLDPEDAALLLSMIEQRRTLGEITIDNYENEIRNLFWCNCVSLYLEYLKKTLMPSLEKSGDAVRFQIINSENPSIAPKWDEARRYGFINVSRDYQDKFEKIFRFCKNDPNLYDGMVAGNKDFCLARTGEGIPLVGYAMAIDKGAKPCKYELTPVFESVVEIIGREFYSLGIGVSKPYLNVMEQYTLKNSKEVETCKNIHEDLCCPGCTNKLGMFSRYSDFACKHGICMTFRKK